jgi:dipeptidyl aminopeptidase/acylaminoacyl peptidase
VIFESTDGTTVDGWIFIPTELDLETSTPQPVITSLHAGRLGVDEPEFDFDNLYWCDQGFIVFPPNYRGSVTYGQAFAEDARSGWGEKYVEDVLAGVDHLIKEGWADSNQLFLHGFSRGGIISGYLLTTTDRFAAAAVERGTFDYHSAFGSSVFRNWHKNPIWSSVVATRTKSRSFKYS